MTNFVHSVYSLCCVDVFASDRANVKFYIVHDVYMGRY